MYLIKVLDNIIEDLENGRTYVLNESIPDYDTNTATTTVYVRSWNSAPNETVDLAHELDAIKLWDHLTSLCKLNTVDASKPDATKAQDVPQEKPREYKYKVGDMVRVNVPNHDNDGETGTVIRVDTAEFTIYPYEVSFTFIESGDDWQETSWHREEDLEDPTEWITKLTPPSSFDPDAIPF